MDVPLRKRESIVAAAIAFGFLADRARNLASFLVTVVLGAVAGLALAIVAPNASVGALLRARQARTRAASGDPA